MGRREGPRLHSIAGLLPPKSARPAPRRFLSSFTSRCLARGLPTFHIKQTHKSPVQLGVWEKEHVSSLGAGEASPGCFLQPRAPKLRKAEGKGGPGGGRDVGVLGCFSPYLLEPLCPAEGTACNRERHHVYQGLETLGRNLLWGARERSCLRFFQLSPLRPVP